MVISSRDIVANPQLRARGLFEVEHHEITGEHELPTLPFRYSRVSSWLHSPSPTLGQHNEEVLSEVGLTSDELASLRDSGILGERVRRRGMSRPDHLLVVDVGYGGAQHDPLSRFVSSLKGQGLGTKRSGCDRYAIKQWKSNAKPRSSVVTGASPGTTGLSGSRRVQTPRQWKCPATILD